MTLLRHRLRAAGLAVVLVAGGAQAAEIVRPLTAPATVSGGTIAATGAYQTALAARPERDSCLIQNNGANAMNLRPAGASASFVVAPGQAFYCAAPGGPVMPEAIEITGTAGDSYTVSEQ